MIPKLWPQSKTKLCGILNGKIITGILEIRTPKKNISYQYLPKDYFEHRQLDLGMAKFLKVTKDGTIEDDPKGSRLQEKRENRSRQKNKTMCTILETKEQPLLCIAAIRPLIPLLCPCNLFLPISLKSEPSNHSISIFSICQHGPCATYSNL